MRVTEVIWLPQIEDKLWQKHRLSVIESEEVLFEEPMAKDRVSSISQARTLEEMAEFWETHSLADYEDQTHEVEITFDASARRSLISIELELMKDLRRIARQRQVSTQTLVNVWLRQRADQVSKDTIEAN